MEIRKIQFRAWDDEINHMYYPPNNHIALFCDGYCVNLQTGKKLIPMLWTGLVDCHGKEIWEWDIVKYSVRSKTFIKSIVWGTCGFWIQGDVFRLQFPNDIIRWKIEVIGNIFGSFVKKLKWLR